jgi:hypothetical protein
MPIEWIKKPTKSHPFLYRIAATICHKVIIQFGILSIYSVFLFFWLLSALRVLDGRELMSIAEAVRNMGFSRTGEAA